MKYGITGLAILGLIFANVPVRALPSSAYLAQSLIGECRAAREGTFIYYEPRSDSGKVRALQVGDRVTLAGNGASGWIAVSEPTVGFVPTTALKLCTAEKMTQCARTGTFIYEKPSSQSSLIRSVLANEKVIVSTEVVEGWYQVFEPIAGYIQEIRLKPCESGTPTSPNTANPRPTPRPVERTSLCYRVTDLVNPGLNVRAQPTEAAEAIRSLSPGTLVRLKATTSLVDSNGRSWVEIVSPVAGWVSDGFPGNQSNLSPVSCEVTR